MFIFRLNKALSASVGIAALWLLFTAEGGSALHLRLGLLLYTALLILIITGFAQKNLLGQERYQRFGALLLFTSMSIFLTFASGNLLLLGLGWSLSGIGAILLVNHANNQKSRRAARDIAIWFSISDGSFWLALLIAHTHHLNLFTAGRVTPLHGSLIIDLIAFLLLISGVIRSGLFPAMRWLILTIEAPSPLSALLHAGIVNGFGFILIAFPIMHAMSALITSIALLTIVMALAIMRHRHDEKGKLANGTSMQMAFMALEGVLGIPGIVLLHIVGHGSYKSWNFLRAGGAPLRRKSAVPLSRLDKPPLAISILLVAAFFATVWISYSWLGNELLLNLSVASIALASSLLFAHKLPPRLLVVSVLLSFSLFGAYLVELDFVTSLFPKLWEPNVGIILSSALFILLATALLRVIPRSATLQIASRAHRYLSPRNRVKKLYWQLRNHPAASIEGGKLLDLVEITASPFEKGMALTHIVAQNSLVGLSNLDYLTASEVAQNYGITLYSPAAQYLAWLESGAIDRKTLERSLLSTDPSLTIDSLIEQARVCASEESGRAENFGRLDPLGVAANWWSAQAWYDGRADVNSGGYEIWRASLPKKYRQEFPISSEQALAKFLPAMISEPSSREAITDSQIPFALQRLISIDISWFLFVRGLGSDAVLSLLALRAALSLITGEPLQAVEKPRTSDAHIWQSALEQTFAESLLAQICNAPSESDGEVVPEVALVTCIDVRSDILRERAELVQGVRTVGMAGFFGVDIAVTGFRTSENASENFAPVIVKPSITIKDLRNPTLLWEIPTLWKYATSGSGALAVAEGFGFINGIQSALNTFAPQVSHRFNRHFVSPRWLGSTGLDLSQLSTEQKIEYASGILATLSLENLSEVLFIGHGADAPNTPFRSMFECGACGGNNGVLNARFAATLMNDPVVQELIRSQYGERSPRFFAAEHNTTLGTVQLDPETSGDFRESSSAVAKKLLESIALLPKRAFPNSEGFIEEVGEAVVSAKDSTAWWQVFPEWGLSGNAACVIGPRSLTKSLNLCSRVFLHDYAWEQDADGQVLASIFSGPGVVMQMINAAYNIAVTNPQNFSSDDKTRHNVLGEAGVLLGADGPLYRGLPWQSIAAEPQEISGVENTHLPLRLQILVAAPREKIELALKKSTLAPLAAGGWVSVHSIYENV
jgi:formate hydrogenlyase subunit 3/multisubunit Na+/H+ antiporter MnhD subunit